LTTFYDSCVLEFTKKFGATLALLLRTNLSADSAAISGVSGASGASGACRAVAELFAHMDAEWDAIDWPQFFAERDVVDGAKLEALAATMTAYEPYFAGGFFMQGKSCAVGGVLLPIRLGLLIPKVLLVARMSVQASREWDSIHTLNPEALVAYWNVLFSIEAIAREAPCAFELFDEADIPDAYGRMLTSCKAALKSCKTEIEIRVKCGIEEVVASCEKCCASMNVPQAVSSLTMGPAQNHA
jgi:hypothetical protein